jgi:hypothetical protein
MSKPTSTSLYHQLRRAKKLDELMLFLENPSLPKPGSYSRCVEAGPMVAGWGFARSPSSIWRLYRQHILAWRMGVAQSGVTYAEDPALVEREIREMAAQRAFEFLAHPDLDPNVLVHLARIEQQKEVIRHQKEKFKAAQLTKLEFAVEALSEEIKSRPQAVVAFTAPRETLKS